MRKFFFSLFLAFMVFISMYAQETSTPQPTPTPTALPTPTQDPILAKGQAILNNTSIEEKVGQMFIARCPETNATDDVSEDQLGILAILAGNDLLCCTDFQQQIGYVIDAFYNGTISQERIDASVLRILIFKIELGLIQ